MISTATLHDMGGLIEMGLAFYEESGFSNETEFSAESFSQTCTHLIGSGGVFVAKHGDKYVGMAGAMAYPFYFNKAHMTAQEMFWWVAPEFRGGVSAMKLLRALEWWAASKGCQSISMISLPKLTHSPAASLYQRIGYRASEQTFIRSL
jgi:GNAT superfamily N-acetyltransferase